jgi:acetylornithine deacetylase/succinyl-diaminopimelate desuccinylase-like protein
MDLARAREGVMSKLVDDEVVSFLAGLVEVPSPTGHELGAATYMHQRLLELGVDSRLQVFDEDRANVIARLHGSGGGPTVMLNGHLDTSYTGDEPELVGAGYKNEAVFIGDDWLYGNGVHNMKNALASYYGVMAAIVRSGLQLAGDVVLAGVAGEIERAPFGRFQGPEYEGFGTGTGYALAHGLDADMCILGEPSTNAIGISNLGVNWVRLGTKGTMAHTQHAETAVNAIYQMQKVMDRLQTWREEYRDRHALDGIRPACDITAIEGGWPYRVSRTPVFCNLFLCIRTTPGTRTTTVKREVDELVRELEAGDPTLKVDLEFYVSHQPTEISREEPVVRAIHRNYVAVTGEEPVYRRRTAYMDSSALNEHGIPTVVFGPSGRTNQSGAQRGWSPEQGEHLYLPDLSVGTKVVAGAVVELCGSTDPSYLRG